ncbi:methyltransferase domain-containing protein [Nanoarchaeota archaeon]
MVKTRGLKEAKVKLGDLSRIVSQMLKKKKKLKIFESGCGYGKVMIELSKKFGDKIEIIGMNLKPSHGDKKIMTDFVLKDKVITKKDLKTMKIPKIIYGDAGVKLPFKTGSIDLVYSQTSSYLYKDKMHFFEEVARVLARGGIARITKPILNDELPKKYSQLLTIKDKKGKREVIFKHYVKGFKNIRLRALPSGKKCVEISPGKLKFNLKLLKTVNVNKINKKWFGIQSFYEVR